ncbi:MAG: UDP-3-O-[3-hydroxymyristoyl] N-acetylglucosamine deacetylase [Candidatus Omnitrophica bacterium]|nr:UDP-3-O-[3-hydroxymyristoyl] N-acetylglucosamine deacetylase [Candidatus Omnitrophota bacterium]
MEKQKTIKKEFFLEGKGLQTGKPVKAFFYPGKENSGIIFVRKDLKGKPSVSLKDLSGLGTDRRSKIDLSGKGEVETVEHVTAALWGAEIDNIRIELDSSEPPALDGSSAEFLKAFKGVGITEQDKTREFVKIKEPIWIEDGESFLGVFPSKIFKVSYILEYPSGSIGRQSFSQVLNPDVFQKEIAPARTFCLKEEAEALLEMGYGKGANYKNTLVMGKDGPIDNVLRFPDEPVRHKVLDLIGDLYLLGRPIRGRIVAIRSGHKLNLELIKKIKPAYRQAESSI